MKKSYLMLISVLFLNLIYSQSVIVKDGETNPNTLLQINDEGKVGSITLKDGDPPIQTTGKLYNSGSNLYWSGSALSTSSGDNLGNHTATQDINMGGFEINLNGGWLSGDGDKEGLIVNSDGNVGIGFGSPTRALQVYDDGITYVNFQSSVTGTGAEDGLEFTISGDNKAYIKNQENASLILGANNLDHLVISNNGNVGIGSSSPNSLLSVGNNGSSTVTIYGGMTDDNGTAVYGNSTGLLGIGTYGQASGDNATGLYGYATHATGTVYGVKGKVNSPNGWAGYFDGRGYFNDNVGIGILNPGNKVHLHQPSSSFSYQKFTNSTTGILSGDGVLIGLDGDENFRVHSYENNDLTFWTNNNEKFRISADGSVGIGTTSPGHLLHVDGEMEVDGAIYADDATGIGFRDDGGNLGLWVEDGGKVGIGVTSPANLLDVTGSVDGEAIVRIDNDDPSGVNTKGLDIVLNCSGHCYSNNAFIRFYRNSTDHLGSIHGDGSGGVSYYTVSDSRLKNDIGGIIDGLDVISYMNVRKYEFKTAPGIENIGFFAQELQRVYPDAVSGSPDSDVNTEPMMIDYGKLTPILVKAIQELQARVVELENR